MYYKIKKISDITVLYKEGNFLCIDRLNYNLPPYYFSYIIIRNIYSIELLNKLDIILTKLGYSDNKTISNLTDIVIDLNSNFYFNSVNARFFLKNLKEYENKISISCLKFIQYYNSIE